MGNEFKKEDLEIVISTMDRENLDFLEPMFPFSTFSDFSILIINQTHKANILVSEFSGVRVINSTEKGLSKSRNVGLKMSVKKILLIADDDEVFKEGFDDFIISSYNSYPKAAVISFQVENEHQKSFRKYLEETKTNLNQLDLFGILSPEMSINKKVLDNSEVQFDVNFGLGARFQMGEEAIFLMDLKSKNQQIVYIPQVIASTPFLTTTDKLDFRVRYYIQGAFLARVLKEKYKVQLAMKLFFDIKQGKLHINQILTALKNAKLGRNDFYKLDN